MTPAPMPAKLTPPTPAERSSSRAPAMQRSALHRPAFWIVAAVLFASAVGLNAAVSKMQLYFRKEPLALRAPEGLMALPREIGPWVMVPEAHTVDADLIHSLGTDKYVF